MPYKQIFFLVEGPDDSRFIEKLVEPILSHSNRDVGTYEYSVKPDDDVEEFISNLTDVEMWEYYLLVDEDKAEEVKEKYDSLDLERLLIVVKEIESWYMAGLKENDAGEIGAPYYSNTDSLVKEEFNGIIPDRYEERTIFMIDLLELFDIEEARDSNESFHESSEEIPLNPR